MNFIIIPWWQLIFSGLTAAGLVLVVTPWVLRLTAKWRLFDTPGGRHIHARPIPRLGGLAIFVGVVGALLLWFGFDPRLYGVLLGGAAFFALGLSDDIYSLTPPVKLFGQLTAASIPILFGITITNLTNPFGGTLLLAPGWDIVLTLIWILLIVNTVNFLDGLDGLAAGVSAIAAIVLMGLSLFAIVNQPDTAMWAAMVAGGAAGFLVYNWHPAKIFMGDAGSHFLGFMLASLAIISGGKVATAALVLGLPIVDLAWSLLRRVRQGQAPWSADRGHLHHRLFDLGLSQRAVVGFLYLLTLGLGLVALLSGTWAKLAALIGAALVLAGILRLVLYYRR